MNRACAALGLSRATAYRGMRSVVPPKAAARKRCSARRIPDDERAAIVEVLDSERFIDQPPREVYAELLSEGTYHCSWRTMYRLLGERGPVKERRNQRLARHHAIPRLVASAPNQVWTWDISKLATYTRGVFLNLYVILDMYSRYAVAWMVAEHENSALAQQLFREAVLRYSVDAGTLIVHQDRGAPMTSHSFVDLLYELGVARSYSRPRVSDDNPFSEAAFRTVKSQPDYPQRFRDVGHARQWMSEFFAWYNTKHHHEGLALFTPEEVFAERVTEVAERRQAALSAAYERTPQRFVLGRPTTAQPPQRVLLNPLDAAPPTAATLLEADPAQLTQHFPARAQDIPVVHVPGASLTVRLALNAS